MPPATSSPVTHSSSADELPQGGTRLLPRLIYSWPYLEWGGAQTYLIDIARRAADFRTVAVLPLGSSPALLGYLSELSEPCEFVAAHQDLSLARTVRRRLGRRLRNARVGRLFARRLGALADATSLLHIDFAPWSSARLLAGLARRRPTFVTLHTRLPEIAPWRQRLWRARLRQLVALPGFHLLTSNRDCRDSLRPYLGDEVCEGIPVAYPCFDVSEIPSGEAALSSAALRDRLGLPHNRLFVAVAAQFIERKGCWTFLEAAAHLAQQNSRLFFVWLGTDELSPSTRARIEASPAAPAFSYIPSRLSGATRSAFLGTLAALADIFVLPSVVEGLPLALGEAMALGKPVVATRINAVPEAVCHETNGLLVEPLDVEDLARSIGRFAGSPELRQRLGLAARATIATQFGARQTIDVTLAAYRLALQPFANQLV